MSKSSIVDCQECGAIMVCNGWLVTKQGRAQRYHCQECGANTHGATQPHGRPAKK